MPASQGMTGCERSSRPTGSPAGILLFDWRMCTVAAKATRVETSLLERLMRPAPSMPRR